MSNWVLVALPMFVYMGLMLDRSGVAEKMMTNFVRVFRGMRGGLAITVVLMGILLAASTGIVGASVVLLATLSIPIMMRQNYSQGARFRRGGGRRHARNPDSAVDHAGDHGRPALDFGRRPVHGRIDPGGGARIPVSRSTSSSLALVRPDMAPAPPEAEPLTGREIWGAIMRDRSHRRSDHCGAGDHLHRLRHAQRSVGRRRVRRNAARAVQRTAQSESDPAGRHRNRADHRPSSSASSSAPPPSRW